MEIRIETAATHVIFSGSGTVSANPSINMRSLQDHLSEKINASKENNLPLFRR